MVLQLLSHIIDSNLVLDCAEDSVEPERDASLEDLMNIWTNNQLLGPVFDRVEVVEGRCRFIMSELHQDKYPEDEQTARNFYDGLS